MRITGLSIDGFGIFNGVTLEHLPPGLILILGGNEAGKSTALAFIHTVLFGYPDGRSKSDKPYPPLNGGSPGGRLMLDTDVRGAVTVERKEGPKGGKVTLTYADGGTGGTNALEKILGGTNRKLYRNLYGFSLAELQTIDTLTNEDVRDVIYGASLGTGLRTLPEARKRLNKRMAELFKPGGSKPTMNLCLKEIEETRKQLREAQKGIAEYEEAGKTIADLTTKIEETSDEIKDDREHHAHVKALLQLWDDWVAFQEAQTRLAALEVRVEDFPHRGLVRLDESVETIAREKEELQTATADLEAKRKRLEGLPFHEDLLQQSAAITSLIQGLETYEKAVPAYASAQARVEEHKAQVAESLAELGADWTEERALALDRSTRVKEEISTHKSALGAAGGDSTTVAAAFEGKSIAVQDAEEEEKAARAKVEKLEGAGLHLDRRVLEKLRSGKDQFTSVLADLPKRKAEHRVAGETFDRTLREIHPDWTAKTLDMLDVSLPAQQKIEQFEKDLLDAQAAVRDAKAGLENTASAIEKVKRTLEEKCTALEIAGGEVEESSDLEVRRSQARELRQTVQRRTSIELELKYQEQMLAGAVAEPETAAGPEGRRLLLFSAIGLAGFGMLVAAILFKVDQRVAAGVSVLLAVLLGTGLLLLRRNLPVTPPGRGRPRADATELKLREKELNKQLDELTPEIEELQRELGAGGELNLADADRLVGDAERQLDQVGPRLRLVESIRELDVRAKQAQDGLADADRTLKAAKKDLSSTFDAWRTHARSLHLPADTSPRTARLVFAKAEKARSERRQLDGLLARIEEMTPVRFGYLAVMAEVPRLKAVVDKKDDAILADLTTFLTEMEQQEGRLRELEHARETLQDAVARTSTAVDKMGQAKALLVEAEKRREAAESVWEQWLENHDMDAAWSPDIAEHALGRVIRLAEVAGDRKSAEANATRLQKEAEAYRQRAAAVFKSIGRSVPKGDQLPVEIRRLEEERALNATNRNLHAQLATDISETETRRETRLTGIKQAEARRDHLVKTGEAKDEEEFRHRGKLHEQLGTLTADIAALESNIRKLSGTADLNALEAELAGESRDHLTAEQAELKTRIEEAEPRLAAAYEERGAAEKHQRSLYSNDRVTQLRAREEGLLEDLEVYARDWARHAVANHLLDEAKERHAQANQPKVIQAAGRYFETITGGRYVKVFSPPGGNTMKVIDSEGRSKDADDLSRGAMEQLYLAIRFGYIAAQETGPESLPLLMDDVLVNFDPERTRAAAAAILQLAQTRQIFFFTCHPELVEIFRKQDANVPIYQIAEADFGTQPS